MSDLFRAELLKLRTNPVAIFGLFGAAITITVLSAAMQASSQELTDEPLSYLLRPLMLSQIFTAVVASATFGSEYESSCLRTTYLTHPQRFQVVFVKLLVTLMSILVCGSAGTAVGWALLDIELAEPLPLMSILPVVGKSFLSWTGIALLASGLSVITRSLIAPVAILVPLMLGVSQILFNVTRYAAYLPDLATNQVFTQKTNPDLLAPWPGLGVQLIWVLASFVLASLVLRNSDVR